MTEVDYLRQLDLLERHEKVVDRLEKLLPTAEKLALHLNAQTDDATSLIFQLLELNRGLAFLLNQTSIKLMEKNIHQLIGEYETTQERGKHFDPGIPKKILNGVGK